MILKDGDSRALAGLALDTMKHADPFGFSGTDGAGRLQCLLDHHTPLLILVNVHEATAIILSKI